MLKDKTKAKFRIINAAVSLQLLNSLETLDEEIIVNLIEAHK